MPAQSLQQCLTHVSQRHYGLYSARLLCPWDSPGKNTGVGCHALLQEIVPTQGLNLGPLHCRQILYHLSHQGSPYPNERENGKRNFQQVVPGQAGVLWGLRPLIPRLCNSSILCFLTVFNLHHRIPVYGYFVDTPMYRSPHFVPN